jgi:hypothetical protein
MKGAWAKCPLCGAGIKRSCLKYGKPFPCPECQRLLVAPLHPGMAALVGGTALGLFAYALGARGTWLVVATCLLVLPGLMACAFLWTLFVPPSLRPSNSDPAGQTAHDAAPGHCDAARRETTGEYDLDRRSKLSK